MNNREIPRVVLVGRQNVGKSTLYNRLLKRRVAITDRTPGVTRDALWSECYDEDGSVRYLLCDTGGQTDEASEVEQHVMQIAQQKYHTATVLLFVLDINQLTAEDMMVSESLAAHRARVICVLNKADSQNKEFLKSDFFRLGFKHIVAISAQHNRNIEELTEAIERITATVTESSADSTHTAPAAAPDTTAVADDTHVPSAKYTVAIIGKPNAGKSTLINALVDNSVSLVLDTPGTTRDTVRSQWQFDVYGRTNIVEIIDTAGLRRTRKINEAIEYYALTRTQDALQAADIVLLLIDSSIGLTESDKKIAQRATALGRGVIFVYNKIDLVQDAQRTREERREELRYHFPHLAYVPLVEISALKKSGFSALTEQLMNIWTALNSRIPTSQLNRATQEWMTDRVPYSRIRFMYATQTSTNPLRFVFFFRYLQHAPTAFASYLTNRLREEFNLHGTPILLDIRNRNRTHIKH